jgi:hypothetical protein
MGKIEKYLDEKMDQLRDWGEVMGYCAVIGAIAGFLFAGIVIVIAEIIYR